MAQSYYGGFLGNAGALDDLVYRGEPVGIETLPYYGGDMGVTPLVNNERMAGSAGYFLPEAEIQKRMQERYYQTPAGQGLIEKTNKLKQKIQQGNFFPTAGIGNIGGLMA